jgi:hypothetical protein
MGRPEEAVPPELGMATSAAASVTNRVGPGPFPSMVQN